VPTNPAFRTRHRASVRELGLWDRFQLEHGPLMPRESLARLEELWAIHGPQVTREWAEKRPGTRPWGWWTFEAPEPRQECNSPPEGSNLEASDRRRGGEVLIPNPNRAHPGLVPWLESELAYLERLNLLDVT
jgi:hypothetical protein